VLALSSTETQESAGNYWHCMLRPG